MNERELDKSYERFVRKSKPLSLSKDEILLGNSETIVTFKQYLMLFTTHWPLWDKDKRDIYIGLSETGLGIRVRGFDK